MFVKGINYLKSLSICNFVSMIFFAIFFTLTMIFKFANLDFIKNINETTPLFQIWSISLLIFASIWLLVFFGMLFLISYINIVLYNVYLIKTLKKENAYSLKYIIGYFPFVSSTLYLFVKNFSDEQTQFNFKKYYLMNSIYFSFLITLFLNFLYVEYIIGFDGLTIVGIIFFMSIWNLVLFITLIIIGIIYLVFAINRVNNDTNKFNKVNRSLKFYLFIPIFTSYKLVENVK